ncbi:hypothetical protein V5P93_001641 [Actinokineospora auranticolor]|uniref:Uncharacterized protein n=1 Tax=Actinokineospora auranticolor TaxID=155976 RepID=A0A2S6GCG7_9PSEU|nr:hypothetical protein [Actinokineospora auranticolor]PPK62374.1 hypothetical protein CLV40_13516 [Actinokineospora auranticolor]
MAGGYTVDTTSLAIRVGELKALAEEVDAAAGALQGASGDLGPGDLAAAAQEVADQWRDDLGSMRDKIDKIADNVRRAVDNYEQVEQGGADRMRLLVNNTVAEQQMQALRAGTARRLGAIDQVLNPGGTP